jgi:hypothetical protein
MSTIRDRIHETASRLSGLLAERIARSRGPTYEDVRAEMGGAPWREVPKSTDAWFILDEEAQALGAPSYPRRRRLALFGLATAICLGLALLATRALGGHAPSAPSAAALATPAPAPVATPAPAPPPTPAQTTSVAAPRIASHATSAHHAVPSTKRHHHR